MPFLPVVGFPAVTTLHVYIKIIYSPRICLFVCFFCFVWVFRYVPFKREILERKSINGLSIGHLKGIHSFSCSNMLLFGSVSFVLKIKIIVSF